MRAYILFILFLQCVAITSCNRGSSSDQERQAKCAAYSQEECKREEICIYDAKNKRCEAKIAWNQCVDLNSSSFQCEEAELRQSNPFGCIYRNNLCAIAGACSDLSNNTQCVRAKSCIFVSDKCEDQKNIHVKKLLEDKDPEIQKWFYEAYTAFGAYLHYYQELAKTNNKAGIEQKMNDVRRAFGLPGELVNQKSWLGTPKDKEFIGDLDAIDASITDPALRQIWISWASHPGNFLSWILYPVHWIERADLADLNNKFLKHQPHGNLIMWGDDGLCSFSWIMNLSVADCPAMPTPRPDPTKWLHKINGNVAITTP